MANLRLSSVDPKALTAAQRLLVAQQQNFIKSERRAGASTVAPHGR